MIQIFLRVYANHSKKKGIDLEDVKLASTMLLDKTFTGPPPREILTEVSKLKNTQPLPMIKPHSGIRLPPDRHCLLAANYKLRAATANASTKKLVKSAIEGSTIKTKISSDGSSTSSMKKATLSQTVNKSQNISIPKPVFKITTTVKPPQIQGEKIEKMEIDSDIGIKRKRSMEEDYDVQ
jgi:transcription initiation factor TFIID subunit 9B